jgi:hypothetical protein
LWLAVGPIQPPIARRCKGSSRFQLPDDHAPAATCIANASCRPAARRAKNAKTIAVSTLRAADADTVCCPAIVLHRKRPNAHACRGSRLGVDHPRIQTAKPPDDACRDRSPRMRGANAEIGELPLRNIAERADIRRENGEFTASASAPEFHRQKPESCFDNNGRKPPVGLFNHRIRPQLRASHPLTLGHCARHSPLHHSAIPTNRNANQV